MPICTSNAVIIHPAKFHVIVDTIGWTCRGGGGSGFCQKPWVGQCFLDPYFGFCSIFIHKFFENLPDGAPFLSSPSPLTPCVSLCLILDPTLSRNVFLWKLYGLLTIKPSFNKPLLKLFKLHSLKRIKNIS